VDLKVKNNTTIKHSNHQNVGKAKNIAMQHLLDSKCDYIFTMEDDIEITDASKGIIFRDSNGVRHRYRAGTEGQLIEEIVT
jgi:hypothetical protein